MVFGELYFSLPGRPCKVRVTHQVIAQSSASLVFDSWIVNWSVLSVVWEYWTAERLWMSRVWGLGGGLATVVSVRVKEEMVVRICILDGSLIEWGSRCGMWRVAGEEMDSIGVMKCVEPGMNGNGTECGIYFFEHP